jgi:colicin import membrane protein
MMRTREWFAFAGAGLLAVAGCASQQKQNDLSPSAQQAQTSQQQSQQALARASDAQKQATEQAKKAQDAHRDVAKAQAKLEQSRQELQQAQQRERQEQAKAEQLQQQASQATRQATQQAQQSQQRAATALSTETQRTERGEHTVSGQVVAAAPTQLVLQASAGQMTLQLDENTKVRIDGRESSASQIVQGEQARVSFQTSTSSRPTATSVEVSSTGQLPPAGESQGMGSSSQQGGMGSSSQSSGSGSSSQSSSGPSPQQ